MVSSFAIWTWCVLAAVWLAIGALTLFGARRRGRRWPIASLSGLFFPVAWVVWYLVDERAAGGRSTRQLRRQA
jgi:hypothetical protein